MAQRAWLFKKISALCWVAILSSSWALAAPQPAKSWSHQEWNQLLKENWKSAKLPYAKLKKNPALLDSYLKKASQFDPSLLKTRDEKLAFWINLYNACTLRIILDHYPLAAGNKVDQISVKSDQGEPTTIWQKSFCEVRGRTLTLDQIEKEILIGELKEPMVHFAINCGALSCPDLRNEAYDGRRLKTQLAEQARKFLADSSRNNFDQKKKVIQFSMIFGWYAEDFQNAAGGSLTRFLLPYVAKDLRQWIDKPDVQVDYIEYDWTLNDIEVFQGLNRNSAK